MNSNDFRPLHIRAWLRTPVVSDKYLPLDGLLLYQAHRDAHGAQDVTLPGQYSAQGGVDLPLARQHFRKGDWYYRCAWAQWPQDVTEGRDYWNKRLDQSLIDMVDFRGKRGNVLIDKGRYKSYHSTIYYRSALWAAWYCVGDPEQIEYLLRTVTHIGKKQTQGWGRVTRWEITETDADWSVWRGDRLMRGIPPEDAPGYETGIYGIRPSYWNRSNQMELALP